MDTKLVIESGAHAEQVDIPQPSSSQLSPNVEGNNSIRQREWSVSDDAYSDGSESPNAGDLPVPLLQKGWRKFWSEKESRPYFYNKLTKQSMWEYPGLEGDLDDPLGIKSLGESSPGSVTSASPGPITSPGPIPSQLDVRLSRASTDIPTTPPVMDRKRHNSFEGQAASASPSSKRARFHTDFWNFTVHSNLTMDLREPSLLPCPHPEVELLRFKLTRDARQNFGKTLQMREGIEAPTNAYNRALLAHKVVDKGTDPMMPTDCTPEVCQALIREILNDIPFKVVRPGNTLDARKLLCNYSEAIKHMVETRPTEKEDRKIALWHVEDTFQWLREKNRPTFEDYCVRLAFMKKNCQPLLASVVKPSVEGICMKWFNTCRDVAKKVSDKNQEILQKANIVVPEMPEVPEKRVACYPVHMITPSPPLPEVEYWPDQETVNLIYAGESMRITKMHFVKLETLYKFHARNDKHLKKFIARTWCLLKRYQSSYGSSAEGFGMQAALSPAVFEALHKLFDVTFECFASPLNCYFKQYCSAFLDTDGFYGSRGPILDFKPRTGSLEANPPFCEELMEAMLTHFERLLQETSEPLSFIIFVPEMREHVADYLVRLESSRFNRKQVILPPYEHEYRHGMQHTCLNQNEVSVKSMHGTLVVFLQNDAGHEKWGPTPEKIKELIVAAKPK